MMKFLATGIVMMFIGCDDFVTPPPVVPPAQPEDRSPSWSPDAQWIAYFHLTPNRDDSAYSTGLYLTDVKGQQRKLVIRGSVFNPDWSPDGKKIVFASGDIFTIAPTGDSLTSITNVGNAYFPSWSPGGYTIAFDTPYGDSQGANHIWLVRSDGTNLRDISEHGVGEWRDPDWSPDGNRLVHLRFQSGVFGEEIFVMDTTGVDAQRLTFNQNNDRDPSWSPDGLAIVWTVSYSGNSEIWLMNSDGSSQHKIADGLEPSWSPDSQQLVFSRRMQPDGKMVLWIVNVDGTNLRQLTY